MPVVILLAALAASLTIGELHHKAQDKNDAQLLLAHVEEDAAEQQLVEDEAITDERVTPEILAEIRDKRDEIKESIDELQPEPRWRKPCESAKQPGLLRNRSGRRTAPHR